MDRHLDKEVETVRQIDIDTDGQTERQTNPKHTDRDYKRQTN